MYHMYESIPFGVIILEGETLLIKYFNKRFQDLLNLQQEFIGTSYDTIVSLEKLSTVIKKCYEDKSQQQLNSIELLPDRYFTATFCGRQDQIEIYFQETTELVLEYKNRVEQSENKLNNEREKFLGISTELKTKCDIIEILRDREKEHLMHLKDVINNISEGLIVIDNRGKISLSNRAAYSITKLNIGELVATSALFGKYFVYQIDSDDNAANFIYEKIYSKNVPIKNLVLKLVDKNDYSILYLEINSNPIFNKDRQVIYTILTLKDVTETKIHQAMAEEQSNFVKDVVNTLDVPIAVIDYPELTYKLVNKKYKIILKSMVEQVIESDKIIGSQIGNNFGHYSKKNLRNALYNVGEKGQEYSISPYRIIDENNNERFYKIKLHPYKDAKGSVRRIHAHGLDITEEVNHSLELEKITRLKDEFFTVISHELRTPLTIIYSSLQLANDIYKEEITSNVDKTLKRIYQNCSRLLKLINNILDLSKAEAGFLTINCSNFDIVSTTELIVGSVNLYARSKNIDLIFDTDEEEYMVCLDKDKYEKILLNLLSNAIKFTPEGKQILVVLNMGDEFISLSVKDQGIGIPSNKLDYIFDRFAQVNTSLSRRAEGTGIGLSLVKKLTEYMSGKILVKSREGEGSEFNVEFSKSNLATNSMVEIASMDTTINDKINIEFSDIN